MQDEDGRGTWSPRTTAIAVFFVGFIVVQVAVPLVRLWEPRPARFGWQMFTAQPRRARYLLVMSNGAKRPVDLRRYVAQSRGEMDLTTALPPHLCRVVPEVAFVEVLRPGLQQPQVYACR